MCGGHAAGRWYSTCANARPARRVRRDPALLSRGGPDGDRLRSRSPAGNTSPQAPCGLAGSPSGSRLATGRVSTNPPGRQPNERVESFLSLTSQTRSHGGGTAMRWTKAMLAAALAVAIAPAVATGAPRADAARIGKARTAWEHEGARLAKHLPLTDRYADAVATPLPRDVATFEDSWLDAAGDLDRN